jgi:hypothetical protein
VPFAPEYRSFLELLKPKRQSLTIRAILTPPRQPDHLPDDRFSPSSRNGPSWISSNRSDNDAEIWGDPDQIGIKAAWWIFESGKLLPA